MQTYVFYMLYTTDNFLADVGGYLGLFLGLSCFGLIELAETAAIWHAEKKKKKRDGSVRDIRDDDDDDDAFCWN